MNGRAIEIVAQAVALVFIVAIIAQACTGALW